MDLAHELRIAIHEADIDLYEASRTEEVFVTSTSFCLCPVRSVNGRRVGDGTIPGPVTQELLTAYSELVGLDIVAQYLAHLETTDR